MKQKVIFGIIKQKAIFGIIKEKIIFGIMEKLKNIKKTRYFNFHICVKEVNLPLTLEIFFHDY